jgi:hypothetical protein
MGNSFSKAIPVWIETYKAKTELTHNSTGQNLRTGKAKRSRVSILQLKKYFGTPLDYRLLSSGACTPESLSFL